jgi:hypothetical protein
VFRTLEAWRTSEPLASSLPFTGSLTSDRQRARSNRPNTAVRQQAGEKINQAIISDSVRWKATDGVSGADTPHMFVKPTQDGLWATLTITTTRRVYHLRLESPVVGRTSTSAFTIRKTTPLARALRRALRNGGPPPNEPKPQLRLLIRARSSTRSTTSPERTSFGRPRSATTARTPISTSPRSRATSRNRTRSTTEPTRSPTIRTIEPTDNSSSTACQPNSR